MLILIKKIFDPYQKREQVFENLKYINLDEYIERK